MVMANTERVAKALGLLRDGLGPACEDTWRGFYGDGWLQKVNSRLHTSESSPRPWLQRTRILNRPRLQATVRLRGARHPRRVHGGVAAGAS